MDYQVKMDGQRIAGAWSECAARRKAVGIALAEVHGRRRAVEVWKGLQLVTRFIAGSHSGRPPGQVLRIINAIGGGHV